MDRVNTKINILGIEYQIEYREIEQKYNASEYADGFCDYVNKQIVIDPNGASDSYINHLLRHEIVHAFLNESGIQDNYRAESKYGHDENIVDWFAIQYPKINKVFKQLNIQEV